ncbi:unnamed protein product [Rotaria sp. Silwood2]|nr:unnamed protein product [Rotaria sp. Silwood2]CAF2896252.1 unnamed protein product [Rotaria sp. Silwood2]CAF4179005.1 unnamed protein product [Rotaria sp. Silwood2]CAF4227812.1 unnamed protein product [Rotaria sp. Silwood2]
MKFLFRYFIPATIKMSYSISRRIPLGPGQESVWDYPRPPRVEDTSKHIEVIFNGIVIADTRRAKRVLETSHPPTYYLPPEDVCLKEFFKPISNEKSSYCEWKGVANYYTIEVNGKRAENAAWYYSKPTEPQFSSIKDHIAIYASQMDECRVDGERVIPQPGQFYGGWITKDIVGPFKGEPGSMGW